MKKNNIKIKLRIPGELYTRMQEDLRRPHDFAWERMGFAYADTVKLDDATLLVTFKEYQPVKDGHYLPDEEVGARIGSTAIQEAMQHIFDTRLGGFHVHLHDFPGRPSPSATDRKGLPPVAESLANTNSRQAHGILILSEDSVHAQVKISDSAELVVPESVAVIRYPMILEFQGKRPPIKNPVFDRQSFLGPASGMLLANVHVGIVGLGGGGSHLVQQLAHLGVRHFTLFDFDHLSPTNHNRLIGGYYSDIEAETLKTAIAERLIRNLCPDAVIRIVNSRWEEYPDALKVCDIVFGGVDTFQERSQLEAECRRYLMPYIDIGMDVHEAEKGHQMSGQVILSLPGGPCMRCLDFLTEKNLAREAARYGDTGGRPQVVWPNGVLASSAIGIFTDLLTGWSGMRDRVAYLVYDGNTGVIGDHIRLRFAPGRCVHYPISQIGKPRYVKL